MNTHRTTPLALVAVTSFSGLGCDADEEPADPCAFLAVVADSEDFALTPRADENAEVIAMRCSHGFFADQELYEMVVADFEAMAAVDPHVAGFREHDRADFVPFMHISTDTEGEANAIAASPEFACVVDMLGATVEVEVREAYSWVELRTDGVLDMAGFAQLLVDEGVSERAETTSMDGDGDRLRWREVDGVREWLLLEGVGDCPAGCAGVHGYWFRIEADGTATLLGEWANAAEDHLDFHEEAAGLPTDPPAAMRDGPGWGCYRCRGIVEPNWGPDDVIVEVCGNDFDDDCSGRADCDDWQCFDDPGCPLEDCDNGIDDEGDGRIDCDDVECSEELVCTECTLQRVLREPPEVAAYSVALQTSVRICEDDGAPGSDEYAGCMQNQLAGDWNRGEPIEECVGCWVDWAVCARGRCGAACDWDYEGECPGCAEEHCNAPLATCMQPWATAVR